MQGDDEGLDQLVSRLDSTLEPMELAAIREMRQQILRDRAEKRVVVHACRVIGFERPIYGEGYVGLTLWNDTRNAGESFDMPALEHTFTIGDRITFIHDYRRPSLETLSLRINDGPVIDLVFRVVGGAQIARIIPGMPQQ